MALDAPIRLVGVDQLGESGVTVVADTPHGALAVGLSDGTPFAVSNRCRHLRAELGKGCVDANGELECPWHGALYDITTGEMTRGPGGVFRPLAGTVKMTLGRFRLQVYACELRDDAIWLLD